MARTSEARDDGPLPVGLIADIVGSRGLGDRSAAQDAIHDAFASAHAQIIPREPAWATVGDEFQAVYHSWRDAARATLHLLVGLPEGLRVRCGLGEGAIRDIEEGDRGPIQDGEGWLRAREAVEEAARRGRRRGEVVSWFVGADEDRATAVNAHLLLRDHVVSRMKSRERRICAHLLAGGTQEQVAGRERISQSAVSQALHRSGAAALLEADRLFAQGRTP